MSLSQVQEPPTPSLESFQEGEFQARLLHYASLNEIPQRAASILNEFHRSYRDALIGAGKDPIVADKIFVTLSSLVRDQCISPYHFESYHKQVVEPFDFFVWGNEFLRPLVNFSESTLEGNAQLNQLKQQLADGHNVILLANHQTEADPGLLSLLLETENEDLAKNMIFIAGDRVLSDPLCTPFTLGRNCLTVFSKRHHDDVEELKVKKKAHNQSTMRKMGELLKEGGKCIYVAPSGGRDRPGIDHLKNWRVGDPVEIAKFDGSSIELFRLIAEGRNMPPCHFYPLAMDTHDIMPPPPAVEAEIGERRVVHYRPVHLEFLPEVKLTAINKSESGKELSGTELREARASHVW
eukprot:CAMPEP_0184657758 /NCGR_PEP_ID=MMETSP0308-20130426/21745_1 /TAXON_ID=38269 /ORGANISM="Gloeochaete witrockiana, Strain SAG 46.84" /LENGTH=350 /DNA_ID=CAMNT_0027096003 /DNA_START=172 /DNA_END=1221 /DNA_ORIENTATION=-